MKVLVEFPYTLSKKVYQMMVIENRGGVVFFCKYEMCCKTNWPIVTVSQGPRSPRDSQAKLVPISACSCPFPLSLCARALGVPLPRSSDSRPSTHPLVARVDASATVTMTATTSLPIDIRPLNQTLASANPDDEFDEFPDETVLKTGWLTKKGRHGVSSIIYFRQKTNLPLRIGRNAGLSCGRTDWPTTRMNGYRHATYISLAKG